MTREVKEMKRRELKKLAMITMAIVMITGCGRTADTQSNSQDVQRNGNAVPTVIETTVYIW